MTTAAEVAGWMVAELSRVKHLYQEEIVADIERKFGTQFIHANENGNPAIDRKVLKVFRELTGNTVVWERSERMWRRREPGDQAGRQQE